MSDPTPRLEVPPAAELHGHTVVVRTDAPHLVSLRSIEAVKFEVVDTAIAGDAFDQPSPMRLLMTLLRNVDEAAWAHTGGRLLCEMTAPELVLQSRLGRSTVYKASKELVEAGWIKIDHGGGRNPNVYEIILPGQRRPHCPRTETPADEPAETGAPEVSLTPRTRAPYDDAEEAPTSPDNLAQVSTPVDGRRALMGARHPSTPVDPRRALMLGRQARAQAGRVPSDMGGRQARAQGGRLPFAEGELLIDRVHAGAGAFAAASAAAAEGAGERDAAAAAALRQLGVPPAVAADLARLSTTTPIVATAAGLEAKHKPDHQRIGLIITLVRDPSRISPKSIERANRLLVATAAAAVTRARPAEPPAEDPRLVGIRAALDSLDAAGRQHLAEQVLASTTAAHRELLERYRDQPQHRVWQAALENHLLTAPLEQEAPCHGS